MDCWKLLGFGCKVSAMLETFVTLLETLPGFTFYWRFCAEKRAPQVFEVLLLILLAGGSL